MITERTLRKWRKEALEIMEKDAKNLLASQVVAAAKSILKMTQELLDQHLLRREK